MKIQEFMQQNGEPVDKAVGAHVFMQGDKDTSLYYIQSGFLKAYYVTETGKEQIKSFLVPGGVIGSLTAAVAQDICTYSLLCLEPSRLIRVSFVKIYQQMQNDMEMAREFIDVLLKLAIKKEHREYEFLCLSAEERYRHLIEQSPEFLNKITQENMAKYLGVTPVGLSRIKKRVLGIG